MRRSSVAARMVAGAVLVAGVVAVAAQPSAAGSGPTIVRTVSPFDASGVLKPAYHVVRREGRGVCQAGSYQTGSAYRCQTPDAAAGILDPCWPLTAAASTMVCQGKPWDDRLVEVHVVAIATGGPSSRPTALPWGLRIGAGIRCLRDVGSVLRVDGNALLYHCSHHRDVFGPLHPSGAQWRAHVYRTNAHTASGEQSVGWRAISIVWRGGPPVVPAPSSSPTPTATPTPTSTPTPIPTTTPTPTGS